ncbi:carboxylate-amine ligase [Actinomycetospora soli]|uniref:carboxylate-amine ligase n=1 Tax=Actinomycetospora soli TaxID=2893887 RepID=UPI001E471344|nr:glutamate--cysteine ligase [Actinomycetospora soli]MCD2185891.1 glutamate--cysteine ligase [Actinomycetospora soli]
MDASTRRMGVEEELLLVDPDDGTPLGLAPAVLPAADDLDGEMRAEQVETGSVPHVDAGALAADLRRRRADAARAARTSGAAVAALATSPVPPGPATSVEGRYGRILERFGAIATAQLTNGQHVHVEIASREEGVGVLDRLGAWLPVLRALSANSPFWRGEDTGYASYRSLVWARMPSAGPSAVFGSVDAYDAAVTAMVATDTIVDDGMVYFDARLAAHFPTVEVRVTDVSLTVDDAVTIALLARALVTTAATAWAEGGPPTPTPVEVLRLAHWRAARSGCVGSGETGVLVHPVSGRPVPAREAVSALLEHVDAALGADRDSVHDGVRRVLDGTTGAAAQRTAFASGGLQEVVRSAQVGTDGR